MNNLLHQLYAIERAKWYCFDYDAADAAVRARIAAEPMPHNLMPPTPGWPKEPTVCDNTDKYYAKMLATCEEYNANNIRVSIKKEITTC